MEKDIILKVIKYCEQCNNFYDCDNNYSEDRLLECEKIKNIRR